MSDVGIVKGILIHRTEKALLIEQEGEQTWVPESVCMHISTHPLGNGTTSIEMEIESWWLDKHNLQEEP